MRLREQGFRQGIDEHACNNAVRNDGLITGQIRYSAKKTISCFEVAVRPKQVLGFTVFTAIVHATAGRKFGPKMRPHTLAIFGNPKFGTPVMTKTQTLAIEDPPPTGLAGAGISAKTALSIGASSESGLLAGFALGFSAAWEVCPTDRYRTDLHLGEYAVRSYNRQMRSKSSLPVVPKTTVCELPAGANQSKLVGGEIFRRSGSIFLN